MTIEIRSIAPKDQTWLQQVMHNEFGSTRVVSRGVLHQVDLLPVFIALLDDMPIGLLAYHVANGELEVVALSVTLPGRGLGSRLLAAARQQAQALGCRRLWLITTNDNTPAIRFYQRQGMTLVRVHHNAVVDARQIKPEIPLTGVDGQPICDEIEFEFDLAAENIV